MAVYKWPNGFISLAQWVAFNLIHCAFRRQYHPASLLVAGFGVVGLFGPRVGNSSGVLPGNSCGCDGSPGSRTGGGISGLGLPGGLSSGGSVGCPGVAGGISGGSIGISSPNGLNFSGDNDEVTAKFRRRLLARAGQMKAGRVCDNASAMPRTRAT